MGSMRSKFFNRAKPFLRPLARATLGRLPPPQSRLTGTLAKEGGTPVRDVRLRPWASERDNLFADWRSGARTRLRRVFLSGVEGLPQPLAQEFAQAWAKHCGCQYGLLLAHGTDALRIALAAMFDHD